MHENLIKKIEGLDNLVELACINLSDNCIEKIEGLDNNKKLQTLLLKRNRVGHNGVEDYSYLTTLKSVSVLDLSNNKIDHDDAEAFIHILEAMDSLAVLYLTGNPIIKRIPNYRKTLTARLPNLKYLDDRPVFPDERRYAEAFCKGGIEAEREERIKVKQEEDERQEANHRYFREFVENARKERQQKEELEKGVGALNEGLSSDIDPKNLDTYYSSSKGDSHKGEESSSLNKSHSEEASKSDKVPSEKSETEELSHSDTSSNHGDEKASKPTKADNQTKAVAEPEVQFSEYMSELD